MIYHKMKNKNPKFGVDTIEIENNIFEFQCNADLWTNEIKKLVNPYDKNKKFKVTYRDGKVGYITKKTILPMWNL